MSTPPSGYQSPFQGQMSSGTTANPFSQFNQMQSWQPGQRNRGNRRSPWEAFSPAVQGKAGAGIDSAMAERGYQKKGGGWVRYDQAGTPHFMSDQQAQKAAGNTMGGQTAGAAFSDYGELKGILGGQNEDRADYYNSLQEHRSQLETDRQAAVGQMQDTTQLQSEEMKDLADSNFEKFEQYRDKVVASTKGYAGKVESMVTSAIENYDANAMGTISAAAGGLAVRAEMDVQNARNMANAMGLDPSVMTSLEHRVRGEASRQIQGTVGGLVDQKNQILLGASMQGAGVMGQAGQTVAGVETQAMVGTERALARQEQNYQVANAWVQAGQVQAAQTSLQYEQLKIEVGNQMAGALANLTQKYPSLYDTFLQAGFGIKQFGSRTPLNLGALS